MLFLVFFFYGDRTHRFTFAFGYHVKEEPIILYVFTTKEMEKRYE